jgi:molybdate transport system substrate-binding protein
MRRTTIAMGLMVMCGVLLSHAALYAQLPEVLTVSAAISLKNAFDDIGRIFESQHRGSKVQFNYGASGDLKKQIEGGAPVDVFASASSKEVDELLAQNMLLQDTVVQFARNSVVLIQPKRSAVALHTFGDLTQEAVQKIALGNPQTVPAGRYAKEALEYLKLFDALKDKYVFAENVRQVLDYAARGEVDAGIVYLTDAQVMADKVTVVIEAPEASHQPVIYPMAVIRGTKHEAAARAFVRLMNTDTARQILSKYGFK